MAEGGSGNDNSGSKLDHEPNQPITDPSGVSQNISKEMGVENDQRESQRNKDTLQQTQRKKGEYRSKRPKQQQQNRVTGDSRKREVFIVSTSQPGRRERRERGRQKHYGRRGGVEECREEGSQEHDSRRVQRDGGERQKEEELTEKENASECMEKKDMKRYGRESSSQHKEPQNAQNEGRKQRKGKTSRTTVERVRSEEMLPENSNVERNSVEHAGRSGKNVCEGVIESKNMGSQSEAGVGNSRKGHQFSRPWGRKNRPRAVDDKWRERVSEKGGSESEIGTEELSHHGETSERKLESKERQERGGERRAVKRSARSSAQKREKAKQVAPSLQSSELTEQLSSGSYCCMVCCDKVRSRDPVWSCRECYHVFHLECISKWATSPASLVNDKDPAEGWRCPACQNPSDTVPTLYKCFCGKVTNPRPHRSRGDLTAPHSCGELCGRSLARTPQSFCRHKCQLLCHPGPCPPCPVMVTRSCPCGKQKYQIRCSKGDDLPSCGSECGRWLNCSRHRCTQSCHSGSCGECEIVLTQQCYCGRSQREVTCGKQSEEERYECALTCGKELNCCNHLCELTCHPPPCPPCHLLPSQVTTCPCGATPLLALLPPDQSRTSCLDPVPTCGRICSKTLPCSTKAEPHFCPSMCHEGPCLPCEKSRLVRCRCGRGNTRVDCQDMGRVGVYECDKPCNKMKSCGRHRCSTRCCVDTEHQCNLICGKKLQCGNHCCNQPCHRGHCEQCWEYSYEELTCHCGAEVLYPPLPCGTRPPSCKRVCARMHACSHPVAHSCHNEEECPPCTVLTERMCMGGHEKRFNIPCHISDISCGNACGKDLPCNRHKCQKICHRGSCMDSPDQCSQPCQTPRKYCSHVCGEPCHVGSDCPDVPCKAEVALMCKCGRIKQRVMCGASSTGVMQQAFHKILSKDLGAKIRDLQSGQSVSLARVSLAGLGRERDMLDCDEVCLQIERNRTLAEALGISSAVLDPFQSPLPKYPPSLVDHARRDPAVASSIEEELKSFVDLVRKGSGEQVRRHRFVPMPSHERRVVHELAPLYGCDSLSYDEEPFRHVTVSTKKTKAKMPTISLMEMIEKEKEQKLATPNPASIQPPDLTRLSGPLEIARESGGAVEKVEKESKKTDYFADDIV